MSDLQQATTQLLQQLIRFDTVNPPGNERLLQELLLGELTGAGFECELLGAEPERPNLVARSRIRGGIGLRGPGETQLETDRRVIRRKISNLKRRLEEVANHRANQRQGRRDLPSAALVGYTNP